MTERTPRRDDAGRARAGSMLQMQIYANAREDRLSAAVIDAAGTALAGARIGWKSPREAASYAEYMDAAFLAEVGIGHAREELAAFWPKSGPRWDGLGIASSPAGNTILLVEAKSYVEEMAGGGCKATEPARSKIVLALDRAKRHFGANEDADWTGPFYQYANRLAHLYFIREVVGAQALLVNLCFVDDQWTSPKRPTSADDWRAGIAGVKKALGFGMGPIPGVVDVLLTALGPEELDGPEVPASGGARSKLACPWQHPGPRSPPTSSTRSARSTDSTGTGCTATVTGCACARTGCASRRRPAPRRCTSYGAAPPGTVRGPGRPSLAHVTTTKASPAPWFCPEMVVAAGM